MTIAPYTGTYSNAFSASSTSSTADSNSIVIQVREAPVATEQKASPVLHREETTVCCICLDTIDQNSNIPLIALVCKHKFHKPCLEPWIKTKVTELAIPKCPLCKADISDETIRSEFPTILRPIIRQENSSPSKIIGCAIVAAVVIMVVIVGSLYLFSHD